MNPLNDVGRLLYDWLTEDPQTPRPPAIPEPARNYRIRPGSRAVVLCLDVSGSMGGVDYAPSRLAGAQRAAERYCLALAEHEPDTLVGLVSFSDEVLVHCHPVPARETQAALLPALRRLQAGGGTHLGDGLELAARELARVPSPANPTIILLTDGASCGGADPLLVAPALKRRGVQLDCIGIGGSPAEVNETDLKGMASVVKGQVRYWFIESADELVARFEALALREFK